MTTDQRNHLLSLLDAVFEETATADQIAQLEQLVIGNPEARSLYVRASSLHGMLYWDAAGAPGEQFAEESETAAPAVQKSVGTNQSVGRRRLTAGLAIAGSILALLLLALFMQPPPALQPNNSAAVVDNNSESVVEPVIDPVEIPGLSMPGIRTHVPQETPVVADVLPAPDIQLPQALLVDVIDKQLAQEWKANEIAANPRATDAEWVRRVYLDLAGRIPTVAEAEAFLSDKNTEKDTLLVKRLLSGNEAAANLANIWTNLLVGRMTRTPINRPALETYLTNQFAANRPWSETVTDLITAEGNGDDNGAANFLLAHLNNEAVPATAITARVLLGQQVQCSQCHRHPVVSEWDQDHFWTFNACFQQTRIVETTMIDQETGERTRIRELADEPGTKGSFYETLEGVVKVAYPGYDGQEISLEPETNRRAALAELLLGDEESDVARAFVNRIWAQFFGYGFTSSVDDMGPHSPVSHPKLLDELSKRFVSSDYNVQELVEAICLSEAYRLSSKVPETTDDNPEHGSLPLFSRVYVKPMSPEQMFQSLVVSSGASPSQIHSSMEMKSLREEWLGQFFRPDETEENSESCTFDGSLRQALSLMNGDLVQSVTSAESGTLLDDLASSNESDVTKIRKICMATLSRYPSDRELASLRQVLRSYVRQRTERNVPARLAVNEGLRDLYWAYLNSSEFGLVQ
ncbi:MAG: DUF1553 domain-containing protein [Planctomycetaceae bacterium]|nr:DUF1553 domain-containing protein [Planctomycetaceae bacterium]